LHGNNTAVCHNVTRLSFGCVLPWRQNVRDEKVILTVEIRKTINAYVMAINFWFIEKHA
jgi:hypothetical protein